MLYLFNFVAVLSYEKSGGLKLSHKKVYFGVNTIFTPKTDKIKKATNSRIKNE